MVPDSGGAAGDSGADRAANDGRTADATSDGNEQSADGGVEPGFDEAALYVVVRDAVEDAILGVIGTLLLVGIAFVLVWVGAVTAIQTGTAAGAALGGGAVVAGFYVAASSLGVVPPLREWR